jgi:hypothetical protein
MKKIIFIAIFIAVALKCSAQDDAPVVGFYMISKGGLIKVYQSKIDPATHETIDEPDITPNGWNKWTETYWFVTDMIKKVGDSTYIRITIPNGVIWNAKAQRYLPDTKYKQPVLWPQTGVPIDSDDFNSWLWVSKTAFDTYKKNYYGRPKFQIAISGISIPFKYRGQTRGHASSILNGDINLGSFGGARLPIIQNSGGITLGGFFGVASLPMSSANNSGITDKNASQSITGMNWGVASVFDWQKKFQLGIVWGWDHAVGDLSKTYLYQNKSWIGISLNYKFLDFGGKDKTTQTGSDTKAKTKP